MVGGRRLLDVKARLLEMHCDDAEDLGDDVLSKSQLNLYCGFVDIPSPSSSEQMKRDHAVAVVTRFERSSLEEKAIHVEATSSYLVFVCALLLHNVAGR